MYQTDEINKLQLKLAEALELFGRLTHPAVVAISQELDRFILDYYLQQRTPLRFPFRMDAENRGDFN